MPNNHEEEQAAAAKMDFFNYEIAGEQQAKLANRPESRRVHRYVWVFISLPVIGFAISCVMNGPVWGLLIGFCFVPVFCLFGIGILFIIEAMAKRNDATKVPAKSPPSEQHSKASEQNEAADN